MDKKILPVLLNVTVRPLARIFKISPAFMAEVIFLIIVGVTGFVALSY